MEQSTFQHLATTLLGYMGVEGMEQCQGNSSSSSSTSTSSSSSQGSGESTSAVGAGHKCMHNFFERERGDGGGWRRSDSAYSQWGVKS